MKFYFSPEPYNLDNIEIEGGFLKLKARLYSKFYTKETAIIEKIYVRINNEAFNCKLYVQNIDEDENYSYKKIILPNKFGKGGENLNNLFIEIIIPIDKLKSRTIVELVLCFPDESRNTFTFHAEPNNDSYFISEIKRKHSTVISFNICLTLILFMLIVIWTNLNENVYGQFNINAISIITTAILFLGISINAIKAMIPLIGSVYNLFENITFYTDASFYKFLATRSSTFFLSILVCIAFYLSCFIYLPVTLEYNENYYTLYHMEKDVGYLPVKNKKIYRSDFNSFFLGLKNNDTATIPINNFRVLGMFNGNIELNLKKLCCLEANTFTLKIANQCSEGDAMPVPVSSLNDSIYLHKQFRNYFSNASVKTPPGIKIISDADVYTLSYYGGDCLNSDTINNVIKNLQKTEEFKNVEKLLSSNASSFDLNTTNMIKSELDLLYNKYFGLIENKQIINVVTLQACVNHFCETLNGGNDANIKAQLGIYLIFTNYVNTATSPEAFESIISYFNKVYGQTKIYKNLHEVYTYNCFKLLIYNYAALRNKLPAPAKEKYDANIQNILNRYKIGDKEKKEVNKFIASLCDEGTGKPQFQF